MREAEQAKFENKTFAELLEHAKKWKADMREMNTVLFSKVHMMRVRNKVHLFAIATPPKSGCQTIYSAPIPTDFPDPDENVNEIKLEPAYDIESLIKKLPPSDELTMLCERQRSSVVQGVADIEICKGDMLLLAGDQLFRYDPVKRTMKSISIGSAEESEMNLVEPMDISGPPTFSPGNKGCSIEHPTTTAGSTSGEGSGTTSNEKAQSSLPPSRYFVSSAKVCPADSSVLAYVLNKQVYIEKNGHIVYRTTSDSKHITNGVPSYIVQEELERFEGIWWSEHRTRLLYEHVNEEMVEDAQFCVNGESPSLPMKYPRAGTKNATSQLRMVILENDKAYDVALPDDVLRKLCPNYEYITRAGFFSDGVSVWVQLMSRDQSECFMVLVPMWEFDLPPELRGGAPIDKGLQLANDLNMSQWDPNSVEKKPPSGKIRKSFVVHRGRSDYWINTHNAIYPLKVVNEEEPKYEFIYCLERPNGSCLCVISAELDDNGYPRHCEETLLMGENFSINKSVGIVVDEKRELVYFVANESHPTEWNLCVSHYRKGTHTQLTQTGHCFKSDRSNGKIAIEFDTGLTCWMTGLGVPPECKYYKFQWTEGKEFPEIVFQAIVKLSGKEPAPMKVHVDSPEMVEYISKRTGLIHYGLILRPLNFDGSKKYPVIHYVYGGPGIQIVHNDYSWIQFARFTRLGYVVVIIDNRGSAHRGIDFEGHLSRKMGTVEVEDQIEGLQMLCAHSDGFMDLSRVVVHGWSYGGYMALQMLAKHPNVYRAAIAGGAVYDWRLYDTAYTERYMGFPIVDQIYSASAIKKLVTLLPVEPNRLMLVHGLMDENVHFSHLTALIDECIKNGKWHELLVFPHERHGIRNTDASIYLDARMMYFAQTAINNSLNMPLDGPNE